MGGPSPLTLSIVLAAMLTAPIALTASSAPAGAIVDGPPARAQDADGPSVSQCVGFAPVQTGCGLEHHGDQGGQSHECLAGPGYTGTVVSNIFWPYSEYVWRIECHYEDGELVDQEEEKHLPMFSGIGFSYHCSSYDLHTTESGGSGVWGCILYHD